MTIRTIRYADIDFRKYTACIESSVQQKYTASALFLDIVTKKNWSILVADDYKAVMPFYSVKKMGFEFVINPILCQQLGVFSPEDQPEINDAFLRFLKRKFNVRSYLFNDGNRFSETLNTRKNYILYSDEYENVYKRYSPSRRKRIKQNPEIKSESYINEAVDFASAENFIKQNSKGFGSERQLQEAIRIYHELHDAQKLHLYGFFYNNVLVNLITAYEDDTTVALLGTFNDSAHMKLNGASVLTDEIIKRFVANKDIDFEGSELPSIEEFFRSFRPQLAPYPYLFNSKSDLVKNFIKNLSGNFA